MASDSSNQAGAAAEAEAAAAAAPAGRADGGHRRRGAARRDGEPLPVRRDRPAPERAREPKAGRVRRALLRLHHGRVPGHLGARLRPGHGGPPAARRRVLPRRRLRALLPGHRALQRRVPPPVRRARRRRGVRQLPPAYDDGVDALRFLDARGGVPGLDDDVPVDLGSCFLAGESAGGNIVHHVANRWADAWQASARTLRVAGVFPVQPYFGGVERTPSELALEGVAPVVNLRRSDFSWTAFLPVGATRDHPAAHVTDDNADLADQFPPAMVIIGDFDPLMDWQRRYADVLRRKGKEVLVAEYPGMFHGFYGFPELPEATKVLQDMKAFVDSHRATPKLADA